MPELGRSGYRFFNGDGLGVHGMRSLLVAALALLALTPICAQAGDLRLTLKTPDGRPVQDAVVTYMPSGGIAGRPIRFDWPNVMAQHDIAFEPHVLIVPVGSDVSFPNRDRVRHHVYSFSAAKRFELKLYGREEARSVRFDKPGVVALGCNIHDRMSGFIVVVDTPFAAKSDAAGHAVIRDAPDGAGQLTVWQASMKTRGATVTRPVTLHGDADLAVALDLRAAAGMRMP